MIPNVTFPKQPNQVIASADYNQILETIQEQIRDLHTAHGYFGGNVRFGSESAFDVELSRGAANRLDVGTGDSFRIAGGQLQFSSDVALLRGDTDRLDLASGDSFRIIDGQLQFSTDVNAYRSAADTLQTDNFFNSKSHYPNVTDVYDLGSDILRWATIFVNTINLDFTPGSVIFVDADGDLAEDNGNFFWDDSLNHIVLGGDANLYRSAANTLRTDVNFIVGGDFTVLGTTTTIDSETSTFADNRVLLNSGETGAGVTLLTAGAEIDRGTLDNDWLVFHETTDRWAHSPDNGTTFYQIPEYASNVAPTAGSVLFADGSGRVTQDNASLFWDDAQNRLGINTAAPVTSLANTATLLTDGTTSANTTAFNWLSAGTGWAAAISNTNSTGSGLLIKTAGELAEYALRIVTGDTDSAFLVNSKGNVGIGAISEDATNTLALKTSVGTGIVPSESVLLRGQFDNTSGPQSFLKITAVDGVVIQMGSSRSSADGASIRAAPNGADDHRQEFYLLNRTYTVFQPDFLGLFLESNSPGNTVHIGGGESEYTAASAISFYTAADNTVAGGTLRATFDADGNFGLGTSSFGSSAEKVFAIGNGTAPTTSPANATQAWSEDMLGIAGSASLHVRSERGALWRIGSFDVNGAAIVGQHNTTDATTKSARFGVGHYTNAEEPVAGILAVSNATENEVRIGGGTGNFNAVNTIGIYTTSNQTTLTGTERFRIDSAGVTHLLSSAVGAPLRFGADVDLYRSAANRLALGTGDDLELLSSALLFSQGTTDIDHLWFDDGDNSFNFVADTTYKAAANARVNAGSFAGDGANLTGVDADTLDGQEGTFYLDRANHTGSQSSSTISDFNEAAQDAVGGILADSSSIDFTYDDGANTVTAVVLPAGVNHDALLNFVADEHVAHSGVTFSAGAGLTGGGTIAASRTFNVGAGTGISVGADDVSVAVNGVTNTLLADMAQATVKGRASGAGTGDPTDLTAAQLITILLAADGSGSLLDADFLDGQQGTFYLDRANHTGANDADTLDGLDSAQFLRSDTSDDFTSGILTFNSGTTVRVASGASLQFSTDVALSHGAANRLDLATGDSFRLVGGNLEFGTGPSSLTRSGNHVLTLTSTATTNATIPAGTVTLADLGTAQSFSAVKTFNARPVFGVGATVTDGQTFGWSDVLLSRGTTNRLDLASGDSFNIVSGNFQMAATTVFESDRDVAISLLPNATTTLDLGSSARMWNDVYAESIKYNTNVFRIDSLAVDGLSVVFTESTRSIAPAFDGLESLGVNASRWKAVYSDVVHEQVVVLTDGATPALNAALGATFTLTAAGNRTIAIPTNPVSGQKIVIRHTASGAARTLSLNTGTGGFRFGADITALTATTSGLTDYIGCIYNATANKWDIVAYVKSF